jgi:uncharacterized glyoxalase superfamily protein PhnB
MAQPVPEGTHTLTPHLVVRGAARAIDFYKRAFGATEILRMPGPGALLMHAELQIGDSRVYLADEMPGMSARSPRSLGGSAVTLHLYVPDCDAVFASAVSAGASVIMPVQDAFWGDRYGQVDDPFGHRWSIATHKQDLSAAELERRAADYMARLPAPERSIRSAARTRRRRPGRRTTRSARREAKTRKR